MAQYIQEYILVIMTHYMSRIVRKSDFCLCKNKGADQLRSNCEAAQRLCFRYTDSAISLLKSEISSFKPASVTVQVGLCQVWSQTLKTGFLASYIMGEYILVRMTNQVSFSQTESDILRTTAFTR